MKPVDNQLIEKLKTLVGAECVLARDEELTPYECDSLTLYKQKPAVVVLPENTAQVQAVMRACHEAQVAVVARGAGTGLSGGALPYKNGVLLSLAKMNKIVRISVDDLFADVQPGVRNLEISEAVAVDNLYYAPDPSSQIACTIGGNVAENSGGVHCLKYGLTLHNVLRLKLVSVSGELFEVGGATLDAAGLDLLSLLIGSEGMLAVVVEVRVKLLPVPPHKAVLLASFSDVKQAGDAVARLIGEGIIPAGCEMMDQPAAVAAEAFVHAGYPTDAAAVLICELDGEEADVQQQQAAVIGILQTAGAVEWRLAKDAAEQQKFWLGRKSAFPAVGRLSPDYYCMDGTIPKKHIGEVLQRIEQLSQQFGLRVANVFHAGDGNLHPLIMFDASQKGEIKKAEDLGAAILELCLQMGGTITGEHGVGVEKLNQMCVQFGEDELSQMHAIKQAFDARLLLNPGKAVPTLHRCAEFGAMKVHNNQVPFVDIPRF